MGQRGSRVARKVGDWWAGGDANAASPGQLAITPFVFKRTSSMYFDEDGDLAHEFYEEVVTDRAGKRRAMRKRRKDFLRPQGEVELQFPRLHWDFPIVLCEAPTR